jgi:hypothetical protein
MFRDCDARVLVLVMPKKGKTKRRAKRRIDPHKYDAAMAELLPQVLAVTDQLNRELPRIEGESDEAIDRGLERAARLPALMRRVSQAKGEK